MALNVAMQVYRGVLANLATLATTGKAGVLAWTTDTNEIYVDSGTGSPGIGAGNAWQKVASDLVAVNAQVGTTYAIQGSDRSKLITFTNAAAVAATIAQAGSTFPIGWNTQIINRGAGTVTITPATSTINGGANITVATGQSLEIISDGTNYFALVGKTAINTTGAVAHQFATSNNADGSLNLAQPAFTDISGTATSAQVPALSGLTGAITQTQLPASIGSGSSLTSVDCGTF
jgi:hypothetical protein